MKNVVTTELMRSFDYHMIHDIGIDGLVLMENAARAVAEAVLSRDDSGECVILIGRGNNGGDGLAILRILALMGRSAKGLLLCDPKGYSGDALKNYEIAKKLNLELSSDLKLIEFASIIVDAIFGTGLSKPIERESNEYRAIELANAANAYRIAVDIPSGMNGDSGKVMGIAFNADETITFHCIKRGLLLTPERELVGKLKLAPIGLMDGVHTAIAENEQLIDEEFVRKLLPKRRIVSNKGSFGKALIAAGSKGMPGAAVMASAAALRTGAGLTRACVPEEILPAFVCLPEVMPVADNSKPQGFVESVEWATSIGLGCGMGNDSSVKEKLKCVLCSGKPAVIDADGLNAMDDESRKLLHENCIITPHPGEMARLIGSSVSNVLDNMVETASDFAKRYGCIVLLKSAVSVIAAPDGRLRYNASGNSGLAKGGSGDVLTGIITALLAQGLKPFDASSAGAFLLGRSSDTAMKLLQDRMLTAGDVFNAIESTLKGGLTES